MEKISEVETGELITAQKLNEMIINIEYIKNKLEDLYPKIDMFERKHPEHIYSETIINSIGMTFRLIPAGDFYMGSKKESENSGDERPVHIVKIPKLFYIGIYSVTQQEYNAVMGDNPSQYMGDRLPIENVSWEDAKKFIRNLNEKEGTDKYRLPSEAEWEYAARASTTKAYSFGNDESKLDEYAWYDSNFNNSDPVIHPVGQKKSNPWGLYDMHGNVWEWVEDSWHNYNGESGSSRRVIRGGSWTSKAQHCRSANRGNRHPDERFGDLGFRILKEL